MTNREEIDTVQDLSNSETVEIREPASKVRHTGLSGGCSMWQARLVLSTLDPQGSWASRLRSAIRKGDDTLADCLLGEIYARNTTTSPSDGETTPTSRLAAAANSTVLPPAPGRIAS